MTEDVSSPVISCCFKKRKHSRWFWVVVGCVAFCLWLLLGCIPIALTLIGRHWFAFADASSVSLAGAIGDGFGLANSFATTAALFFLILSIWYQRSDLRINSAALVQAQTEWQGAQDEWRENTQSQERQAELMDRAARLSALSQIYSHFVGQVNDESPSLIGIAAGRREWAVREIFSLLKIDQGHRQRLSEDVMEILRKFLQRQEAYPTDRRGQIREISRAIASLIDDERVPSEVQLSMLPAFRLLESKSRSSWGVSRGPSSDPSLSGVADLKKLETLLTAVDEKAEGALAKWDASSS